MKSTTTSAPVGNVAESAGTTPVVGASATGAAALDESVVVVSVVVDSAEIVSLDAEKAPASSLPHATGTSVSAPTATARARVERRTAWRYRDWDGFEGNMWTTLGNEAESLP